MPVCVRVCERKLRPRLANQQTDAKMCEFYNAGASLCIYIVFKQTGAGVCFKMQVLLFVFI